MLAVRVVDSVEEAIEHINAYGSGHSEAIVTHDRAAARAFQRGVDAACVYVNASTRFTDGGEFGMGAEIGNSTQKLHARGPIGLRELCSTRYLVEGDGQVRGLTLGLLGGTFNPPHLGHLVCAQEALCSSASTGCCACRSTRRRTRRPRRPGRRAADRAVPARRGWRRAVRRSRSLEADLPGRSYTVDTLRGLHESSPEDELTFIMGGDMAHALPTWHEPEAVLSLATLGVAEREGIRRTDIMSASPASPAPTASASSTCPASTSLHPRSAAAGRGPPGPLPRAGRGGRVHRSEGLYA